MKKLILICAITSVCQMSMAQKSEPVKEKKTVKEVINELPDMLLAQPETPADTNANRLINDNVSIVISPLWKEKGLQTIIDYKLLKTDAEPILATMPLPHKKLAQGIVIKSGTIKKTPADKKQAVFTQVKNHISTYNKEAGLSMSTSDLNEKANSMITGPEAFKSDEGRAGEIYYLNDIDSKQSNFIILLLVPSSDGTKTHFVQITYLRYNYETTLPEDIMELKTFVYPEDQQDYIDFTKKILKTLRIQ